MSLKAALTERGIFISRAREQFADRFDKQLMIDGYKNERRNQSGANRILLFKYY